jgi:hypothetical protein
LGFHNRDYTVKVDLLKPVRSELYPISTISPTSLQNSSIIAWYLIDAISEKGFCGAAATKPMHK